MTEGRGIRNIRLGRLLRGVRRANRFQLQRIRRNVRTHAGVPQRGERTGHAILGHPGSTHPRRRRRQLEGAHQPHRLLVLLGRRGRPVGSLRCPLLGHKRGREQNERATGGQQDHANRIPSHDMLRWVAVTTEQGPTPLALARRTASRQAPADAVIERAARTPGLRNEETCREAPVSWNDQAPEQEPHVPQGGTPDSRQGRGARRRHPHLARVLHRPAHRQEGHAGGA
ncbi:MAG: hypothetical protein EA398_02370 [Deltaproteobacteria bacterium]|nr:MAG: hypothetical protein EA398_02370 [Deltaproteobacteria bacterium]